MTEQLDRITSHQCTTPPAKYDDLSVLFLNCTLNRTPVLSHTEGLNGVAKRVFEANGVRAKVIRPVDDEIAAGLGHDMAETPEWERDDWPKLQAEVDACDTLVVCTSVWLGEADPGQSYRAPGSGGPENDFTNRNTTFLAWNCMHLARMLKDQGGIPVHGNQPMSA